MGGKILDGLNEPQRKAVVTTTGPLLVLAGAGTGKTRVVTTRIAHLVATGWPPSAILAVTFTNKAAREMKERVASLVGKATAADVTISTFHSFALNLLRREGRRVGLGRRFSIAGDDDMLGLARSALRELGIAEARVSPRQALTCISSWKNLCLDTEGALAAAVDDDEIVIAHVYERLQEEMARCRIVDFDDMIRLAVILLREHDDVREMVRARFRHVMVDEYQDTNQAQYALVRLVVGDEPNLCVVGDDDQSIYAWRGARAGNILEFTRDFPGAVVVTLEQNYRSTNTILDAANRVIQNNAGRREKNLWSALGAGESITLYRAEDERDEQTWLVSRIEDIHDAGHRYEEIAVLFRANAQSNDLEVALRARNIPYRLLGTRSMFDRREIRDVLSYLRVAHNPADDGALLRILNTPPRGIGKTTRERLSAAATAARTSVFDAMTAAVADLPARSRAAVIGLAERIRELGRAAEAEGVRAAIEKLLDDIEYEAYLKMDARDTLDAQLRWNMLGELLRIADETDANKGRGIAPFLERLALDSLRENERRDEEGDGVLLVTVHAAKGLEFENVFLMGVEEGLFPHRNAVEDEDNPNAIEEERRLFYVAVTRARWRLWLCANRTRRRWGRTEEREESRFIGEMGEGLVDVVDGAATDPVADEMADHYLDKLKNVFGAGRS